MPFLSADHAKRVRRRVEQLLVEHDRSMVSIVGQTPIVQLGPANPHRPVGVWVKLEGANPSGSVKDRMTLYMLADALERGQVGPGTKIVEASSGNTGISLAMLAARLGLKLIITAPDNVSVERYKLIRAYGAELVLTPGEKGTDGAIERARELGAMPGHHWLAQHYNEVNSFAHYESTGSEILAQVRGKRLDAFVCSSGTTGTLMGISARLKEELPSVQVVAVWPIDKIMGIRRPEGAARPEIYDEARIDEVIEVAGQEAIATTTRLARSEGILLGPSGGAAVAGALRYAERLKRTRGAGLVLVLVPDYGERYLSVADTP